MRTRSPHPWMALGVLCLLLPATSLAVDRSVRSELGIPDTARIGAALDGDVPRVHAQLLVHPDDAEGGGPLRVALLLDVAPGWHVYGREAGELGLPTRLTWSADPGSVRDLPWPEPVRFEELDGKIWGLGYGGRVLLPAEVHFEPPGTADPEAIARERNLRVEVELLACATECIPGSFALERDVTVTAAEDARRDAIHALFAVHPGTPEPERATGNTGVWRALALGLLGGLLLNLMPCVLPVLAIKALSVAELARRGPREALPHAAAYAAGVLGSMTVLALLVVALRGVGTAVGWGFQFQEPRYVAAVSAVLVVFAANFFGVFEFGAAPGRLAQLGSQAAGARRSFFDGLLTVALATPCSAPFLGTAAGFAFASPAPATLAVFLAIGAGLAAPLTLVALVPSSARRLPRAGPWMAELRSALGFVLLGTVVWLGWILGRSLDADAMAAIWILLLGVGFLCWLYGRLQQRGHAPRPLLVTLVAGTVFALGLGALRVEADPADAATPWSRQAVADELQAGRPALVVFTADWCITCKVNERLVLANGRVQAELARNDIAVFQADWTRRDESIRAELARFGRSGVPLYLVFSPAEPDTPALLPEILSVDMMVDALRTSARPDAVRTITSPDDDRSIQQDV